MIALFALNLAFNILANGAFRLSAHAASWREVVTWQVVGNVAGFVTVVTLGVLLRYALLSIVFPVTTGPSMLGVRLLAASWLFREPISAAGWAGS